MYRLILICLFISISAHSKIVEEGAFFFDPGKDYLKTIKQHPELTVDHINTKGYEVYGPIGTISFLNILNPKNVHVFSIPKVDARYPTSKEIEEDLIEISRTYPTLTKLVSLGRSNLGKNIWAIKISDNVEEDELEPEVKYIANMHGDEIVGRELLILFIKQLLQDYQSNKPQAVRIVENLETWIVPSMNPDGADKRRRGNNDWVDLNRDFPDFTTTDDENTTEGREPETKAIMLFQSKRNFSLSANFHGGAEVVNYPWDTIGDEHPMHQYVVGISKAYADLVPGMRDSEEFPGGIVNGYDWYEVNGGMQDWSFHWHKDLQITIELSNMKYPPYSMVKKYWNENKVSLFNFLENAITGIGLKILKMNS